LEEKKEKILKRHFKFHGLSLKCEPFLVEQVNYNSLEKFYLMSHRIRWLRKGGYISNQCQVTRGKMLILGKNSRWEMHFICVKRMHKQPYPSLDRAAM
jgi:hypothetical protein